MIGYFIISLFVTFVIVRVWSHLLHDKENYGTVMEKSKTITRFLRRKTGLDIHHIHLGFVLLIISLFYLAFKGATNNFQIMLGISLSMISDQILPLFGYGDYFSKKMIIGAALIHVIISLIAILL